VREKPRPPIEKGKRLSRSVLWKWQRRFFEQQGIDAWRGRIVPHHVTSNPFIADSYAQILAAWRRDCGAGAGKPLHIVELGSGSGRLAYLILQKLLQYSDAPPFKYVMTDISQRTVDYWRSHPYFRRLIKAGVLYTAHFDPERDREIRFEPGGGSVSGPMAVVANYVFDGIPQDTFHARDGRLYEGVVTLRGARGQLSTCDLSYHYRKARANYYEDPAWNQILRDYTRRLPDTKFLFPTSALRMMRNLERISSGHFLLLSADRGYSTDGALRAGKGAPIMTHHGSISMMVDYQVLGEYVRLRGGAVLHPERPAAALHVSAFLLGSSPDGCAETHHAYEQAVRAFGPDDFFTLKEGVEAFYPRMNVEHLLSFLRLSRWDYRRFLEMTPRLRELAGEMSSAQKSEITRAAARVWEAYLPLGETGDMAFITGSLLLELDHPQEALDFFYRSMSLAGEAAETVYHMGMCYQQLGEGKRALRCFNRALRLDPALEAARHMRSAMQRTGRRPSASS
jgi:hypothetical protein